MTLFTYSKGNAEIRGWSEAIYCFYLIIMVILNQILIILGFPLIFIFIELGKKLQLATWKLSHQMIDLKIIWATISCWRLSLLCDVNSMLSVYFYLLPLLWPFSFINFKWISHDHRSITKFTDRHIPTLTILLTPIMQWKTRPKCQCSNLDLCLLTWNLFWNNFSEDYSFIFYYMFKLTITLPSIGFTGLLSY